MSGECEVCGEHTLECTCHLPKLTIRQISISEGIQSQLAPIITEYLDEKPSLIDALDWILMAVHNDERKWLNIYRKSWNKKVKERLEEDKRTFKDLMYYLHPELKIVDGEENLGGYICRLCAMKFGAVPPRDHVCTWHRGICDFCLEEANLCHTTDWNWPDNPEMVYGREY